MFALADENIEVFQRRISLYWRAATHELNTPLGVLRHMVAALEPQVAGRPEGEKILAGAARELSRLVAIADDLQWRNDLDRGAVRVDLAPVDMDSLVSLLTESLLAMESEYPGRLSMMTGLEKPPPVLADADLLRAVLGTLLRNAARYSAPAVKFIRLDLQLDAAGESLIFRAADDAPALLPGYGERVFELMPELPNELGRPRFGLGLGLYAARELARRMGGDVWVEARVAGGDAGAAGNVFALRLPIAKTAETGLAR